MSPLALQKQTCQKLRNVQVKGLAIQGKTKNCTKKNGGRRGCPPSAEDRNFATKKEKINHWNKAEYSGDAPNGDNVDYKINSLIVIHSQPINMFIGVHWSNTFRAQSTLNLVVHRPLMRSKVLQNPGYGWDVGRLDS